MDDDGPAPVAIAPAQDVTRVRRRYVVSRRITELTSHHTVDETAAAHPHTSRSFSPGGFIDDPLKILDNLTSRSVDPLFADHSLIQHRHSKSFRVVTTILTFIVCVALGIGTTSFVQTLHQSSRLNVRLELAKQLTQSDSQQKKLQASITTLQQQINDTSKKLTTTPPLSSEQKDEAILNATSSIRGAGVVVSVDPYEQDNADTSSSNTDGDDPSGRVVDTIIPRDVTDEDLRNIVQLLWNSGAEAISINSHRLGPMTSVRTAGTTILIGLSPLSPPYKIEAIGNINAFSKALTSSDPQQLVTILKEDGISVSYSTDSNITLNASDGLQPRMCSLDTPDERQILCYATEVTEEKGK